MADVGVFAKEVACVITPAGYAAEGCLKGFEFTEAKGLFLRGFDENNGFGVLCRVGFIVVGYIFGNVGCSAIRQDCTGIKLGGADFHRVKEIVESLGATCSAAGLSMRTPAWLFSAQRAYPGWEIMMRLMRR